jgi:WD40 repeat protein
MPANPTALVCPQCGAALAAAGASGLCPRCLLAVGLDEVLIQDPLLALSHPGARLESSATRPLPAFGDYELLEEIARGGMGVVYKARQKSLNRLVAVKMLLAGPFASPEYLARFRAEAETAARLRHPNIVSIIEVGQHEGLPFFSMDYVDGPNLTELVQDGPLEPKRAAACMQTLAATIHHAHSLGVLHRDLKPANMLLDMFEQPRVTDFGLAKHLADPHHASLDPQLTLTGQMLGSPAFMAPEQAAADTIRIAAASDIYSLGAILYWLLTCRPPHLCASLADTVRAVKEDEPVRPRELNRAIPFDLETICMKCLQKEPLQRYPTAQALADDLARFLRDEPILARPIGRTARLWRWCRRKPLVASLVLALNLAFALGLAGVLWQWRRAELNATQEARESRRAEAGELSARLNQYVSDMNLVQQAWEGGNVKRAQTLLRSHIPKPGQPDFRGFEWRYLWRLCQDQSRFTFTNFPGGVSLAISPDGKFAASASDPVIKLLDFLNGRELATLIQPGVMVLSFSSKAPNILAAGAKDGTVKLWDLGTRQVIASLRSETNLTESVAFSPDGKLLASTTAQTVTLWDVQNQKSLWTRPTQSYTSAASFAPNGKSLVTGGGEHFAPIVWDLETGDPSAFPAEHTGEIETTAFSHDGKLLATGGDDGRTILWDYASRTALGRMVGHHGPSLTSQFSPDDRYLASGGADSTVRLWDVASRDPVTVLRGHQGRVISVTFTLDGRSLLSSSGDHTVKVWDTEHKPAVVALQTPTTWVNCPFFSPDGSRLISVHFHESFTRLWDVAAQGSIAVLVGPTNPTAAAFSPDGNQLAIGGRDHKVWVWNPGTLQLHDIFTNHFEVGSISFSKDNRVLVVAGNAWWSRDVPDPLVFWNADSQQRISKAQISASKACAVAFAHHSDLLAVGYLDGTVRLWDFQTENLVKEFREHRGYAWSLAFSRDDALLASGGDDATVALYDVIGRRAFPPLGDHASQIWSVAFASDGRTLASASFDGTIKLWNVATRQVALTLSEHLGPISGVSFSPDGNLMATSGGDGTVRLWPAVSLDEIPRKEIKQK